MPISNRPYWTSPEGNATLYLGDVVECLRRMRTRSVHCCVTSPPYWGLRDYGTGTWEGGSAECDHVERYAEQAHKTSTLGPTAEQRAKGDFRRVLLADNAAFKAIERQFVARCGKCGATRTDHQIGMEDTPKGYISRLVDVFREVRRVLRDDGTLWLNLGDTFDGGQQLIPARVALAMVADGWRLVQDIIWYSPNKMPESVTNRCTKSHEHILLMSKGGDYYFDSVAIEEEGVCPPGTRGGKASEERYRETANGINSRPPETKVYSGTKNKRDVWTVSTTPYPGAHFATFSPKLITPCILAGTSEHGCCASCGAPWDRVVSKDRVTRERPNEYTKKQLGVHQGMNMLPNTVAGVAKETVGWRKVCGCPTGEVVPCIVLDPFVGSGTTVATSLSLGRAGVGIDLSEVYLRKNAVPRIDAALSGGNITRPAPPPVSYVPTPVRRLR